MHLIQTLPEDELNRLVALRNTETIKATIAESRKVALEHPPVPPVVHRAPAGVQTRVLLRREIKNTFRNKQVMGMRIGAAIFMSTLFGGIFWQVGQASTLRTPNYIMPQVMSYVGAITFVAISNMFGNVQPILLSFPKEKPIFIREYSSGAYSATIYYLCKSIVELPILAVQSALSLVVVYFMIGFSGSFPLIWLGMFLIGLASASLAIMFTTRVSQIKTAMELAPLVFVPQIFFSGVFVRIELIPVVLRWIQYIVPLKYGVNIVYLGELNNDEFAWKNQIFEENDVQTDGLWWYIVVLLALIAVFRLIGLWSLVQKARSTVF
jgi:ABC-type multidrug transport system permease subunit